jgi:hypothetical protein
MTAARRVEREFLDDLPASDPDAIHARRDLSLCNTLMLQAAIMSRLLVRYGGRGPRTIVDIGSGDGTFMLGSARRLARRWPGVTLTLVERHDIISNATLAGFAELGWRAERVSADVFDFFDRRRRYDLVIANLFLHHFPPSRLADLLALIAPTTDAFVAGEPRRGLLPAIGCRLLWAFGCNHVTRHDAAASVRAGFRGKEMSALWPRDGGWQLAERDAIPFSHTFAARRTEPGAGA